MKNRATSLAPYGPAGERNSGGVAASMGPMPPARLTEATARMTMPVMISTAWRASVTMVPGRPPSTVKASTSTAERTSALPTSMPKQADQMVDMARYCMAVVGMA